MNFYNFKLLIKRILCYEKPLRVALIRYLSLRFKTFRPHYESILYESCIEAIKLGFNKVSVLELGVASGNGIISLEKYKKVIEKNLNIKIKIYGFDYGQGLPKTNIKEDLPFYWKSGQYKSDNKKLSKKIISKIFYGDIKDTVDDFIKDNPEKICCIFFDLDLYTSTIKFLNQIPKLENYLLPRVLCYFDDLYVPENYLSSFNGELKAINEFNNNFSKYKLGTSIDHLFNYKFPLASRQIYTLHSFDNSLYQKYIGYDVLNHLRIDQISKEKSN